MDLWDDIHEERAALLDTYEGLAPEEWDVPSLCGGWTVRHVLGHLVVAADSSARAFLVPLLQARGSFDRANDRLAREEAARPTAELIARYRERLTTRRSPPGFGAEAPMSDIMLHGLDVRVPLDRPLDRPPSRYEPVLRLLFGRRAAFGFVPRGRPALRWVATDHEWAHGTGDEVRAGMADLALVASGRGARLDQLAGPGTAALVAWLRR